MLENNKTSIILLTIILTFFMLGFALASMLINRIDSDKAVPVINKIVYEIEVLERTKDVNYMYGVATAYTPSAMGINSDSDPTVTSTMAPAKNGVIAVNPDVIPYGSEVMIISGERVIRGQALDTGGHMKENPNQVDILMEDLNEALEWGRREVHILWW